MKAIHITIPEEDINWLDQQKISRSEMIRRLIDKERERTAQQKEAS